MDDEEVYVSWLLNKIDSISEKGIAEKHVSRSIDSLATGFAIMAESRTKDFNFYFLNILDKWAKQPILEETKKILIFTLII